MIGSVYLYFQPYGTSYKLSSLSHTVYSVIFFPLFLPFNQRMFCVKFGQDWPCGSDRILKDVNVFLYAVTVPPLGKIHRHKFLLPNKTLCQVWLNLAQVFLEEKLDFFKSCQCVFIMLLLSPLDKGYGPLFKQTWIRLGMLYVKFGLNCLSNSEEKDADR